MMKQLGKTCLPDFLKKFKMRNQILILNGVIILLALVLLSAYYILHNLLVVGNLEATSSNLLATQTVKEMSKLTIQYTAQLHNLFDRTTYSLEKLNKLYLFVQTHQMEYKYQPNLCYNENTEDIYPDDKQYPLFCISVYGLPPGQYPNGEQFDDLIKFVSIINEIGLGIDLTSMFLPDNFYFVTKDELEFTAWWPQWQRVSDYHPHQRPWYKQHTKTLKNYPDQHEQTTDLYQFYTDRVVVAFTMTQSLLLQDGSFNGVIASDMEVYTMYLQHPTLNIMLVNHDGMLVTTNYKLDSLANSTSPGYFYNQTITGFNEDDWNQIISQLSFQNGTSNCQEDFNNEVNLLCRTNSIYNQGITMSISKLINPDFILIIFSNINFKEIDKSNSEEITHKLLQEIQNSISTWLLLTMIIVLIQIIMLWYIFRPIQQIINHQNHYIQYKQNSKLLFRQNFQLELSYKQPTETSILSQLSYSYRSIFNKLSNQATTKCNTCRTIQKFKYPKTEEQARFQRKCLTGLRDIGSARDYLWN